MIKSAILCIDDEPIILQSLKSQLREGLKNKYLIESAENGADALEVIEELQEDGVDLQMILCDWLMPGMNGDELLVQIHKDHPDIVKVLLTGQAQKEAVKNAEEKANLFTCLNKPWDKEELINLINNALYKKKLK